LSHIQGLFGLSSNVFFSTFLTVQPLAGLILYKNLHIPQVTQALLNESEICHFSFSIFDSLQASHLVIHSSQTLIDTQANRFQDISLYSTFQFSGQQTSSNKS